MGKVASNLPNDSQPWGRDIESRLEKLEALVASNEINNAARDQRMETNLLKVSELLANTAALKSYQAEMPDEDRPYEIIGSGVDNFTIEDLTINFSIDKPRTVALQYLTSCGISQTYSGGTDESSYLSSYISINGVTLSEATDQIYDFYTTSNPMSNKTIATTHVNSEKVTLEAGDYTAKVTIIIGNVNPNTFATFTLKSDSFSVQIIE